MVDVLHCHMGEFSFKYLGIYVGANMNLIKNWKRVVETFRKRLSILKAQSLSYRGRITLPYLYTSFVYIRGCGNNFSKLCMTWSLMV
ncbi:hypothetical protein HanIR_Chr04g0190301 [Helianthus annuus]|nr:hypothetical protein HanIR_Chr04g0190301 [Helianthus annuus]